MKDGMTGRRGSCCSSSWCLCWCRFRSFSLPLLAPPACAGLVDDVLPYVGVDQQAEGDVVSREGWEGRRHAEEGRSRRRGNGTEQRRGTEVPLPAREICTRNLRHKAAHTISDLILFCIRLDPLRLLSLAPRVERRPRRTLRAVDRAEADTSTAGRQHRPAWVCIGARNTCAWSCRPDVCSRPAGPPHSASRRARERQPNPPGGERGGDWTNGTRRRATPRATTSCGASV